MLSIASVRKHYVVSYDGSGEEPGFTVTTKAGTLRFIESEKGLYYYDIAASRYHPPHHAFVTTVAQQREAFTNCQYHQAKLAMEIQEAIGCPSLSAVENNTFRDLPITRRDVLNAEVIFEPSVVSLKDRTTYHKPAHVPSPAVDIPPELLQLHRIVTPVADIFTIDRVPFLLTKTRNVRFTTVQHTPKQDSDTLFSLLVQVFNVHNNGGLVV